MASPNREAALKFADEQIGGRVVSDYILEVEAQLDQLRTISRRYAEALLKYYPPQWAFDMGAPELMVENAIGRLKAERDELQAKLTRLERHCDQVEFPARLKLIEERDEARAERDRLKVENERMREALEFYANPRHWNEDGVCEYTDPKWTLGSTQDEGWHARRVLGSDET